MLGLGREAPWRCDVGGNVTVCVLDIRESLSPAPREVFYDRLVTKGVV